MGFFKKLLKGTGKLVAKGARAALSSATAGLSEQGIAAARALGKFGKKHATTRVAETTNDRSMRTGEAMPGASRARTGTRTRKRAHKDDVQTVINGGGVQHGRKGRKRKQKPKDEFPYEYTPDRRYGSVEAMVDDVTDGVGILTPGVRDVIARDKSSAPKPRKVASPKQIAARERFAAMARARRKSG